MSSDVKMPAQFAVLGVVKHYHSIVLIQALMHISTSGDMVRQIIFKRRGETKTAAGRSGRF